MPQEIPKFNGCTRFDDLWEMLPWARDQKEISDYDAVTTTGSKGHLASYQTLGVFPNAALAEKQEGEPIEMIQNVTDQNGAQVEDSADDTMKRPL